MAQVVKSMVKKAKKDGGIMDAMENPTSGRGMAANERDNANQEFNKRERNYDNANKPGQYGSKDRKAQALSGKSNPKAGQHNISDPMDYGGDSVTTPLAKASQRKRNANDFAGQTGLESTSLYAGTKRKVPYYGQK